jgi:hypothetical protein
VCVCVCVRARARVGIARSRTGTLSASHKVGRWIKQVELTSGSCRRYTNTFRELNVYYAQLVLTMTLYG